MLQGHLQLLIYRPSFVWSCFGCGTGQRTFEDCRFQEKAAVTLANYF